MSTAPFLPDTAPFSAEQRAWLNGFLAGLYSRQAGVAPQTSAPPQTLRPLTIAWGSQTGTAEGLAKRAAKEAGKRGYAATVVDLAQLPAEQLAQHERLLVITSTYGDGEPPDNATAFWTALKSESAAPLPHVRYSVCAIGDRNYTLFCQFGKDVDARLEKLGAMRTAARVDCDLDYEESFQSWLEAALNALSAEGVSTATPAVPPVASAPAPAAHANDKAGWTRANPFPATLKESRNLSGVGSAKSVHHVVFDLADSGLNYQAGDALGVWPRNCPEAVSEILESLGYDGEEAVAIPDGSSLPLREALTRIYDLGKPTVELINRLTPAAVRSGEAPAVPHHVIDVLHARRDAGLSPQDFVGLLRRLQPRLYSISSSPKAHIGEVHLTIGAVRYELSGRKRKGVCSTYLADRAVTGETKVGIFLHSNSAFRPPANPSTPMIMVGPGTGIAPFRAFLEERAASAATGKNWLFFGDQRAATDFLYREEIEAWRSSGLLTRLDTAFSRDQSEKIYVQNRMQENGAELFKWLEEGGHFYVCGDASRMAKDVDRALSEIVTKHGSMSGDAAAAYVDKLKSSKRYVRDVY